MVDDAKKASTHKVEIRGFVNDRLAEGLQNSPQRRGGHRGRRGKMEDSLCDLCVLRASAVNFEPRPTNLD
jgi:hypothetical protein